MSGRPIKRTLRDHEERVVGANDHRWTATARNRIGPRTHLRKSSAVWVKDLPL